MDKRIKWSPDYDFAMLSMMQTFSDEELAHLGMNPETIQKFRDYLKREEDQAKEEQDEIQN